MADLIPTVDELAADESFQNWVNRSNSDDVNKWDAWIATNEMHISIVEEARSVVKIMQALRKKEVAHKKKDLVIEDMTNRLSVKTSDKSFDAVEKDKNISRGLFAGVVSFSLRFKKVAAIFIVLLVSGITVYFVFFNKYPGVISHTTDYGENKSFILSDGSEVNLNANSNLEVNKTLGNKAGREVWLKGEAFFNIKHTSDHERFIVHTENGDIIVLGTEFNVYNRDGKTKVVLTSGKVKISYSNSPDTLLLLPGEMAELSTTQKPVKMVVNTEKYTAWKTNKLIFDNTPLQEIAGLIEDNYGYQVRWTDESIKNIKFSYTHIGNDLDLLLTTLSEALDIKTEKKGNIIYIGSK